MNKERSDSWVLLGRVTAVYARIAAVALACALLLSSAEAQPAHKRSAASKVASKRHSAQKIKPQVAAIVPVEVPLSPPPPLTPEQAPPQKPQVSWDGKQLTIISQNSTLADILAEVRNLTGANIDLPPNASHERVAAKLGPGPAREVLSTLLSWTDFDYVIQASETDELAVHSILLTPRGKTEVGNARGGVVVAGTPRSPYKSPEPEPASEEAAAAENTASAKSEKALEPVVAGTPSDGSGSQAVATASGSVAPADGAGQGADAQAQPDLSAAVTDPNASQAPVSESVQRVQQMQNMYEQRKQMIQEANKPPAN